MLCDVRGGLERITQRKTEKNSWGPAKKFENASGAIEGRAGDVSVITLGWTPTCNHYEKSSFTQEESRGIRSNVDTKSQHISAHSVLQRSITIQKDDDARNANKRREGRESDTQGIFGSGLSAEDSNSQIAFPPPPMPCIVLDPFAGSGTVGQVARNLGRSSILIEIKEEYVQMMKERVDYAHKPLEQFER